MEYLALVLQYAVAPLAVVGWYMFKKQEERVERLEKRTNDMEKVVGKIETELKFIGRDIVEIKNMLSRLSDQNLQQQQQHK